MILLLGLELFDAIPNTFHLMQMTGPEAADEVLDARLGKLYPLVPGISDVVVLPSELKRTS
jgi:hypothetical protein